MSNDLFVSEIWAHKRTGKLVHVYEKAIDYYVRGKENFKSDIEKQEHFQTDWVLFIHLYKIVGELK